MSAISAAWSTNSPPSRGCPRRRCGRPIWAKLLREAVVLQDSGNPEIAFELDLPSKPVPQAVDAAQINRALTNILKNAAESVEARVSAERAAGEDAAPGRILVRLQEGEDGWVVTVADNGRGLPRENRDRLTEPYVDHAREGNRPGPGHRQEDHGRPRAAICSWPTIRRGAGRWSAWCSRLAKRPRAVKKLRAVKTVRAASGPRATKTRQVASRVRRPKAAARPPKTRVPTPKSNTRVR